LALEVDVSGKWENPSGSTTHLPPQGSQTLRLDAAAAGTYKVRLVALRANRIVATSGFTLIATDPPKPEVPQGILVPPPPPVETGTPTGPPSGAATGSALSARLFGRAGMAPATASSIQSTYAPPSVGCGGEPHNASGFAAEFNQLIVSPNVNVTSGAQWWIYQAFVYSLRVNGKYELAGVESPKYAYVQPVLTNDMVTIGGAGEASPLEDTHFTVTTADDWVAAVVYAYLDESGAWHAVVSPATSYTQWTATGPYASSTCYVWSQFNGLS
jgi:hypothetical protein